VSYCQYEHGPMPISYKFLVPCPFPCQHLAKPDNAPLPIEELHALKAQVTAQPVGEEGTLPFLKAGMPAGDPGGDCGRGRTRAVWRLIPSNLSRAARPPRHWVEKMQRSTTYTLSPRRKAGTEQYRLARSLHRHFCDNFLVCPHGRYEPKRYCQIHSFCTIMTRLEVQPHNRVGAKLYLYDGNRAMI